MLLQGYTWKHLTATNTSTVTFQIEAQGGVGLEGVVLLCVTNPCSHPVLVSLSSASRAGSCWSTPTAAELTLLPGGEHRARLQHCQLLFGLSWQRRGCWLQVAAGGTQVRNLLQGRWPESQNRNIPWAWNPQINWGRWAPSRENAWRDKEMRCQEGNNEKQLFWP